MRRYIIPFPVRATDTTSQPLVEEHQATEHSDEQLLGQFIPLHYHFNMLQDINRVTAFRAAIELTVSKGMRVVELGGGTGILSYYAAQQGAEVVCVERNPELVRASRQLLAKNLSSDRVTVVQADAFQYLPEQPVDVVICEMLHSAMLREKQLEVIHSFKQRYREAFGDRLPTFIPVASRLLVQPVEQSFDFADYHAPVPMFQPATAHNERTTPLAEPVVYSHFCYDESIPLLFDWQDDIRIERAGCFNALRFLTQHFVAIDVSQQRSISWPSQFLVLPVDPTLQVEPGQDLRIGFQYAAGQSLESLQGSVFGEVRSPLNTGHVG